MMRLKISLSEKVGQNLKKYIKISAYRTQENFAVAMNAHPTTIRRWIAHGVNDIDTIKKIAEMLEIDIFELLK